MIIKTRNLRLAAIITDVHISLKATSIENHCNGIWVKRIPEQRIVWSWPFFRGGRKTEVPLQRLTNLVNQRTCRTEFISYCCNEYTYKFHTLISSTTLGPVLTERKRTREGSKKKFQTLFALRERILKNETFL